MSEVLPTVPLGDLATITMGQSPDSTTINSVGAGLPFLQGSAEFGARFPQPRLHCSPPLRVAKSGSILISVRAPVGTTNRADQDYCIGRGLGSVLAKPGVADGIFLLHAIEANLEFLHRRSQGSTFLAIGSKELSSLPVPAPEFVVQRRIAEILSTLDEAIAQTEALIAKHQQIKTGLMHDLFTRGITPDGHLRPTREQAPDLYKESPLGWIPQEWEVAEIQTVSSLCVDCPHTTPILSDEGYPMARTSEIRDGGLHIDLSPRVSREQYLSRVSRGVPQEGDIVFTREAPVGEAFVIPPDVELCLGQRVMLIRLNRTRCQPEFFLFQLYSARVQREFDRIVGGTTNPHLNVEDVRKFKICIPNLREQERTASRLLSVSDRMISESKKLAKLRQQKHGLMHDLLTGRVRVPAVKAKEVSTMVHKSSDLEPNT